jgi:DNA-binding response OmpR family regulator
MIFAMTAQFEYGTSRHGPTVISCVDTISSSGKLRMATSSTTHSAVLLVEDDHVQRMASAYILIEAGFEVIEAPDSEAATARLAERPDLVAMVADVDLGGVSLTGFTLAKAVAARWPEIAILIVSGLAWPTEDQMPMGARFLRKPFTPEALVEALRALLVARGTTA